MNKLLFVRRFKNRYKDFKYFNEIMYVLMCERNFYDWLVYFSNGDVCVMEEIIFNGIVEFIIDNKGLNGKIFVEC